MQTRCCCLKRYLFSGECNDVLLNVLSVCVWFAGSGAGLFLWPGSAVHLGCGDPCSWSELHHDWNILRPVCYGGQWRIKDLHKNTHTAQTSNGSVKSVTVTALLNFSFSCGLVLVALSFIYLSKVIANSSAFTETDINKCGFPVNVTDWCVSLPSGIFEPALVTFRSGVVDPLPRHHSHLAGGHLPGCAAPDRHERLPQCAAEHAGQAAVKTVSLAASTRDSPSFSTITCFIFHVFPFTSQHFICEVLFDSFL